MTARTALYKKTSSLKSDDVVDLTKEQLLSSPTLFYEIDDIDYHELWSIG